MIRRGLAPGGQGTAPGPYEDETSARDLLDEVIRAIEADREAVWCDDPTWSGYEAALDVVRQMRARA